MSNTPVTPTITPILTQSWLQRHERLIIVALVLLAGTWSLNRYFDAAAVKADTRASVAEQALNVQKTIDAQNAAQTAQVESQYQAMVSALSAQNSLLAAAAASRQAAVVKNQATDATLALPALADRLKTLGNAPEGTVSVTNGQVALTQPGAVAVTQTLETIPALQADLKDAQTVNGNYEKTIAAADAYTTAQATEIDGLKTTLTAADKTCKAQIADVKAQARKSKWHWFKLGFVTGFVGGLYAGHAGVL